MKLTPVNCPVGTRLIGKESAYTSPLIELTIIEWSSGGLPKVKYPSGYEGWMDSVQRSDFIVVEVLS